MFAKHCTFFINFLGATKLLCLTAALLDPLRKLFLRKWLLLAEGYCIAQNVGRVKLWQNHSTRVFGR